MRAEILILKKPLILNFSKGEEPEVEEAIIIQNKANLAEQSENQFQIRRCKKGMTS